MRIIFLLLFLVSCNKDDVASAINGPSPQAESICEAVQNPQGDWIDYSSGNIYSMSTCGVPGQLCPVNYTNPISNCELGNDFQIFWSINSLGQGVMSFYDCNNNFFDGAEFTVTCDNRMIISNFALDSYPDLVLDRL